VRGKSGGYARALAPAAFALLFQGGFAVAVMLLDRSNRGLPSNVAYVIVVELAAAAVFLGLLAYGHARRMREVGEALPSPLGMASPRARSPSDEAWRALLDAAKAEAARSIAERDGRSRDDLDAFLSSVHAMKTPATALSLLAERAERLGEPLSAADARLEVDELDRALDRALARLRLADFDKGSRIGRFDAAELARASLRKHRRLFISRGIAVELKGGFEAEGDPGWISFILDQLLSNAAKHAASRVVVSLELGEGGRRASIEVADDGAGFGAEDALRAFGRSAYGLYLAREAAARLGAALEILPGEGGRLRLAFARSPGPFADLSAM
jgi:signal transduction histidine kinase